jgi:DNA repair exonuclease SbcCD nuclease subunit
MSGFRFVHAADLHLDTPFEGLARTSPEVAAALRDASLDAFDALVELTLREDAAFLVIAGDVYDGAERGVRAQLRFLAGLRRLSEAGVPVLVAHGNHDPLDGWSAIREWPAGVHVFSPDAVEQVPVERAGTVLATVHGISYARRDPGQNLALRFPGPSGEGLQVGVLHCNVGADPAHAAYSPCSVDDLRRVGLDYWALGHVHQQAILSEKPHVAYPGCLQGRGRWARELGPKGALVVEVEGGVVAGVRHAALDRVRFELVEVDVEPLADLAALREHLSWEAAARRDATPGRGLVLRGRLRGRGPVHGDLRGPQALTELLGELRADEAGADPFAFWESIDDATAPPLDREAILHRDDFQAAFLRLVDAADADPQLAAELAAAALPEALELRLRPWLGDGPLDSEGLLEAAEARALDLLESEAVS